MEYSKLVKQIKNIKTTDDLRNVLKEIGNGVKNIPIMDFEPVVHAHWEDYVDSSQERVYGHSYYGFRCSHCKVDPNREYGLRGLKAKTPRCPKCGARMDEVGKDE